MVALSNVSFSYDSRPVFKGLTLSFGDCWTALIGANGTGKSTLVKLIAGRLAPDLGGISRGGEVAVCAQDRETVPDCFSDPEILNSRAFFALLARLQIGDDWAGRWDTLSGGEKKRCVIADILIRKPAVLILDEPANHIDEPTMQLLVHTLSTFEGTGIVVSHNMAFLNALASSTVLLVAGPPDAGSRAFSFAAPPEEALAEFEKEQEGRRERKQQVALESRKVERAKKDAVEEALREKDKRMSKKHLDIHDSDTRGKVNLARLSGRDKTGGKKVAALTAVLAKKEADLQGMDALGLRKTGAGLRGKKSERPVLFSAEAGSITVAGGAYTLDHPALEVWNDSRIVIIGANGSGKTSLLEHILEHVERHTEHGGHSAAQNGPSCWYLPQELNEESREAALDTLHTLNEKEKGEVLSLVYRLGSEPSAFLTTRRLSPGETRKLFFADAMRRGVSLILLDEPTNHIDTVSADALADAIKEFEGAAILVTHDRIFAEKIGTVFWRIERHGGRGHVIIEQKSTIGRKNIIGTRRKT
ncbi:MAG: ATP-binding cassette domain-containing protein [Spirochaetaceae bacterium]|jgi:ATPase subunit of ABC transporter with duplicated ATPase domains|nr:ATP-binding cassette domain-containing protein [Spirochaetaceae bacterium]